MNAMRRFKDLEVVVEKVISSTNGAEIRTPCYHCGRPNHDAKDCRFREAECHNCGKLGHIALDCKSNSEEISEK